MIKILDNTNSKHLLGAYNLINKDICWTNYGHKGKQAGLQFKKDEDCWSSAVGKSTGNEVTYNNLNLFFKDTIFEELINKHKLLRTRLMWVYPFACYSMHRDETPRVHIPIITNHNCYFVFKAGTVTHLPTDIVWWVNTKLPHTFMNCSEFPRLHLVGVVNE